MLRRLLENWLDSASERSYQDAFCQILAAQGHTVLHNTRHGPLEFGKDIITIGPDKVPCAYQLKGNPGSRLTLDQFRKIQPQLVQLRTQPVIFPGLKVQAFNTFLVTNGIVDEEVQVALDQFNRGFSESGILGRPISIIQKGQILSWANELGLALWPVELESIDRLLRLLVYDGERLFPIELLKDLLASILVLDIEDKRKLGGNELKRRITSAALLSAISIRNFDLKDNYYSEIIAWVIYCAYVISACSRHNKSYVNNGKVAVDLALDSIFHKLSMLCDELIKRRHYAEGDPLVDSIVYQARYTLLVALMSLYWFWLKEINPDKSEHIKFLENFIPKDFSKIFIWGEGALPQIIIHLWYLRATETTTRPDMTLAALLKKITLISNDENRNGLPNPYYSFEDIARHSLKKILISSGADPLQRESFKYTSYFALSLMHLLARTNLKQTCKRLWPDFSRLNFIHFEPEKSWMFCLHKSPKGKTLTVQPKLTKEWDELKLEARDISGKGIPEPMKNKFLLMLFLIILPYRATPSAIRYLGREFNKSWFIDPPIKDSC